MEIISQRLIRDVNTEGGQIHMSAVAAIEIACWDIIGKATNQPLYNLWGGRCHEKLRAYANGWYRGPRTPESFARNAKKVIERGYTALKGDPFKHQGLFTSPQSQRNALKIVAAVRDFVGDDVELLIEVHGRLTPSEAIRFGNAMEQYRPFFYEEPVPPQNVDAMLKVAQAINVPLATGERIYTKWGFKELLEKQVVSVVQPDIGHAGGLSELKKIAAMAETYYVGIAPHNPYGPINTMAALHLDACTPNFLIQEGGSADWYDDILTGHFPTQSGGYFDLPKGPGLGIAIDEDKLLSMPAKPIDVSGDYRHQYVYPSRQGHHWI